MNRFFLIVALSIALISCSKEGIIPKNELKAILTEMYESDQVVIGNEDVRAMADTLYVYESIFNKYGYTTEDYFNSLNYYLDDPKEFSKLFSEIWRYFDNQMSLADLAMESETNEFNVQNSPYAKDIKEFWRLPDSDTLTLFSDSLFIKRNELLYDRLQGFSPIMDKKDLDYQPLTYRRPLPKLKKDIPVDMNSPYYNTLEMVKERENKKWKK